MSIFKVLVPQRRTFLMGAIAVLAATAFMPRTASAITPEEIKKRGKIIIGIQADNQPWGFVNTSGQSDGIDADMGKRFAQELGVQAEFVPLDVVSRIPSLTSGRVDILFATMAMLPDRAKAVQYSKPYIANAIWLVAPKSEKIEKNEDMGKYVIGVPRSSTQDTDITKAAPPNTTIRRYDGDAATIQALLSGQVQAVGGNIFYAARLNASKPNTFENKLPFTKLFNGACTRLGEKEMNAAVNAFIDKIKANGELAKIQEKWMGYSSIDFPDSVEGVPFVAN